MNYKQLAPNRQITTQTRNLWPYSVCAFGFCYLSKNECNMCFKMMFYTLSASPPANETNQVPTKNSQPNFFFSHSVVISKLKLQTLISQRYAMIIFISKNAHMLFVYMFFFLILSFFPLGFYDVN